MGDLEKGEKGQHFQKGEKCLFHHCLPRGEKKNNFQYPMFCVDDYSVVLFEFFKMLRKSLYSHSKSLQRQIKPLQKPFTPWAGTGY